MTSETAHQVLALKWRPKAFDEVVGQATVTQTLKNAIRAGRLGHAFLFSGPRGVGKTTTARILAKALNCAESEAPTTEPCHNCAPCREVAAGNCLDVQEIDGASNNGVEHVRELRESARYNPARDRFKVWIIDEVHMLTGPAFNALLKTLEEPPPRVKFIFATTEPHKLPDTILSRCQQHDFRLIPARVLQSHLRMVSEAEKIRVSDESLARIARAAEGSARDALSLFDQVLSFSGSEVRDEDVAPLLGVVDRELLLAASRGVLEQDSLALLDLVEKLSEYGADSRNFVRELILHFREILLVKLAPDSSVLLDPIVPEERGSARRGVLRGRPAPDPRGADAHRGRAPHRDRPSRQPRAGPAQARSDAPLDALRSTRGASRAPRRGPASPDPGSARRARDDPGRGIHTRAGGCKRRPRSARRGIQNPRRHARRCAAVASRAASRSSGDACG
jgi:DNA polymerase III subunit gamma/tau